MFFLEEVDDKFSVTSLVGNNSVYIVYIFIYIYICISIGSSAFLLETSQLFETFPNPEDTVTSYPNNPFWILKVSIFPVDPQVFVGIPWKTRHSGPFDLSEMDINLETHRNLEM